MANIVSLDRDLVVRHGSTTYQFHRFLDDRGKVQLENQMTGELKVFQTSDFYKKLNTHEIEIVLASQVERDPQAPRFQGILDLSSLPDKVSALLGFKISIIRHIRKKNISRGHGTCQ